MGASHRQVSGKEAGFSGFWDHLQKVPAGIHHKNGAINGPVQSLKSTVVSFVEMVVLDDRNPDKIHFIKNRISGMDSSLENRCIAFIKSKAFCF